ncbi:IS66 family insertion sequence element accessory protein TnpA [Nannocystaceae bacterium ST9]
MPGRTKTQWLEHVTKWRASGLSCRRYAERAGLNHRTLAWYASKLRGEAKATDFVELASVELASSEPLVLCVGEFSVRLPSSFEPAALARLLDVLGARR